MSTPDETENEPDPRPDLPYEHGVAHTVLARNASTGKTVSISGFTLTYCPTDCWDIRDDDEPICILNPDAFRSTAHLLRWLHDLRELVDNGGERNEPWPDNSGAMFR